LNLIFEELDFQETPLGEISLRKRSEPRLDNKIIYEVKMNEEFLMSSLFVEAEVQLARLGLNALNRADFEEQNNSHGYDVIVGGLGLGHTALEALQNPSLKSLRVIDVMEPVIRWHKEGLVPLGNALTSDSCCELALADFFAVATADTTGFNAGSNTDISDNKVHAVLLDIDHTPSFWLNSSNRDFYTIDGLSAMADKIYPKGIFGLWSDEREPNQQFIDLLDQVFASSEAHIVSFPNPYTGEESYNTVYLARK
jgi:hypothetical protein